MHVSDPLYTAQLVMFSIAIQYKLSSKCLLYRNISLLSSFCNNVNLFATTMMIMLYRLFMSQSTLFQLCQDGSSWVGPVLSLAQGHNAVMPVKLEPTALRSRVKHSTTEPLRSLYRLPSLCFLYSMVCQYYVSYTAQIWITLFAIQLNFSLLGLLYQTVCHFFDIQNTCFVFFATQFS